MPNLVHARSSAKSTGVSEKQHANVGSRFLVVLEVPLLWACFNDSWDFAPLVDVADKSLSTQRRLMCSV